MGSFGAPALKRCHYCGKMFPAEEYSAHTVVCDQREVTCHHSWCRKILKQGELRSHMHECLQSRRSLCPKCGESFAASELSTHRGLCDLVQCEYCPERVIPRMIKYCPNTVLGRLHYRVGPFAGERLREKYLLGIDQPVATTPTRTLHGSPSFVAAQQRFGGGGGGGAAAATSTSSGGGGSGRPSGGGAGGGGGALLTSYPSAGNTTPPLLLSQSMGESLSSPRGGVSASFGVFNASRTANNASLTGTFAAVQRNAINYNVARLQHLWRWAKAKAVLEDLMFRIVYRELDTKKETFSIFKAHDHRFFDDHSHHGGGISRRAKQRSAAPVPEQGPTHGHYFPTSASAPITVDIVDRVIQDFTNRVPLPYHAVWRILTEATTLLKAQPNITHLTPPEGAKQVNGRWQMGGKIVVVGDLHGQLADLLTILHENALPSERCMYIFNGDFVDRGHNGLEIFLILLLLLIVFPQFVALNRGNHECEYMNEEYGFDVEVQTKYDRNIYKLVQRCFCALPLATVVGKRIFVVHGGIPRRGDVTFDEIDTIQRFRQIPMPELTQPEEDEIFQDMVWSDPREQPGWEESDRRGVGALFGPDVTELFMKVNALRLVIRSHEEKKAGHDVHHGGRLLTVFSASNYDGPGSNLGATIMLMGDSTEWSAHTHSCHEDDFVLNTGASTPYPATPNTFAVSRTLSTTSFANLAGAGGITSNPNFGHFCASLLGSINLFAMSAETQVFQHLNSERRTRDDVMQTIREQIFERRHRLLAYFTKIDRTQKGSVWKMEWVETMHLVLNLDLPWFFLRPFFTHTEPISHRIRYVSFLSRFRTGVADLWLTPWRIQTLAELSYIVNGRKRHPLANTLAERTEPVGYNEFCGLMRQLAENLSDNELFHLYVGLLDDGRYTCFLSGAAILQAFEQAAQAVDTDPAYDPAGEQYCGWDLTTMEQLTSVVSRLGPKLLQKIFRVGGKNDGIRTFDQFSEGVTTLCRGTKQKLQIPAVARRQLWAFMLEHVTDPNDVGVRVDELILAFSVRDFTSLSERREAFKELTERLLHEAGKPLQRRWSSTFVGFGPSPPPPAEGQSPVVVFGRQDTASPGSLPPGGISVLPMPPATLDPLSSTNGPPGTSVSTARPNRVQPAVGAVARAPSLAPTPKRADLAIPQPGHRSSFDLAPPALSAERKTSGGRGTSGAVAPTVSPTPADVGNSLEDEAASAAANKGPTTTGFSTGSSAPVSPNTSLRRSPPASSSAET